MVKVPFEVVEVWHNDIYVPYTLKPTRPDSEKHYAIRVGDNFFWLGEDGGGMHICDLGNSND